MTAADLATAGFIDERFQYLLALVRQLVPTSAPASDQNVFYSVQKLAAVLDVHPDTVRSMISTGKKVRGRLVKLQPCRPTSEVRISWLAYLAYDRGEDFDLATLPAPLYTPPAELAPAPLPTLSTPETPAALRVA
jgi:hypothetical protein